MNILRGKLSESQIGDIKCAAVLLICCVVPGRMGVSCPILLLTGVSCAGCGMTRALLAMLRLDFKEAFYCHPLFWLVIPAALVLFYRERIPKKVFDSLAAAVCFLFLAVYAARLFLPGDIVRFRPEEGLIWRAVRFLWGRIKAA